MRRIFLTVLIALSCGVVLSAQSRGDSCHVYVADVETARKAFESFSETGRIASDVATGQTVLPEFRSVIGEEELTTRTYPFPGQNS